jgi:hypothetical protein
MTYRDFKRATFFLLSSLLLSIERIKIKNETDVLLKALTLNWLIPLKKSTTIAIAFLH